MADKIRSGGGKVLGTEGEQSGEWVLVDMGSVIVHIMQPAVREYYNLEQLWGGEAPRRASQQHRGAELLATEGRGSAPP